MTRLTTNIYVLTAAALLAGCGGQAETNAAIEAGQARFQAQAAQSAQMAGRAMPQAAAAQEGATAATVGQPLQPALSEAEALAAPMPIPAAEIDGPANPPAADASSPGANVEAGEAAPADTHP